MKQKTLTLSASKAISEIEKQEICNHLAGQT